MWWKEKRLRGVERKSARGGCFFAPRLTRANWARPALASGGTCSAAPISVRRRIPRGWYAFGRSPLFILYVCVLWRRSNAISLLLSCSLAVTCPSRIDPFIPSFRARRGAARRGAARTCSNNFKQSSRQIIAKSKKQKALSFSLLPIQFLENPMLAAKVFI